MKEQKKHSGPATLEMCVYVCVPDDLLGFVRHFIPPLSFHVWLLLHHLHAQLHLVAALHRCV